MDEGSLDQGYKRQSDHVFAKVFVKRVYDVNSVSRVTNIFFSLFFLHRIYYVVNEIHRGKANVSHSRFRLCMFAHL